MASDQRPCAIAIMGPTASGKSSFALQLAKQCNGEIVNMDSAALYTGMDIGTAKPDAGMRAVVRHHLLDVSDPWRPISAAAFAQLAHHALAQIVQRRRLPILVGGTGLYFRAVCSGLAPMPSASPSERAALIAEAAQRGWSALHAELAQVDPIAAQRIHVNDAQRIQRALEVYRVSGQPLTQWQLMAQRPARLPVRLLKCVIAPTDRGSLHARIAERFQAMLGAGFLKEVQALKQVINGLGLSNPLELPALRAVGYRQAWEFLNGRIDYETFCMQSVQATKLLAKRQLTWCRGLLDARWYDLASKRSDLMAAIELFMSARLRVDYG